MLASIYTPANNATKRSLDDMSIASSTAASSIPSIDSIASSAHSSCPDLLYIPPQDLPSPRPCSIVFNDDTTTKQATIIPAKSEDGEVPDIPKIILSRPPFTPQNPATIHVATTSDAISVDSSSSHSIPLRPANPGVTATQVQPATQSGGISEVRQSLSLLYNALHAHYASGTDTPPPQSPTEDSEEEESDDEFNWRTTFPTPPHTPPQGDNAHPPAQWFCGEHPGLGWELNDPLSTSYYPATIPDPTTNRLVVAPFVRYAISRAKSEVAVTFGLGYPVHSRVLQVVPVDYPCPSLTPDQIAIFDGISPLAPGVNRVINNYFPIHLSAEVRRYQYLKEAQYDAQHRIKALKDQIARAEEREQRFLERAMCSLDDLEKANILGRLIAHSTEVHADLSETQQNNFQKAIHGFAGPITQSGIDSRPNPWRQLTHSDITHGVSPKSPRFAGLSHAEFEAGTRRHQLKVREVPPAQRRVVRPWWELRSDGHPPAVRRQIIGAPWWESLLTTEEGLQMLRDTQDDEPLHEAREAADKIEERLRAELQARHDRRSPHPHPHKNKRCYKCHIHGHIRAECPNRRRPWRMRL